MEEKKSVDLKIVYRLCAILFVTVAIVVGTYIDLALNKNFDFVRWLSNTLILVGLTVIGLVFGEGSGNDYAKNKKDGLYQTMLNAYDSIREEIDNIVIYFVPFYRWHSENNLKEKKETYLVDCGMTSYKARIIANYCDYDDVTELMEHPILKVINGKECPIKKLDENEKEFVKDIFKPSFRLDCYSASYYLQALSNGSKKTDLEQDKEMVENQKASNKQRRTIRVFGTLFFAILMGGLVVGENQNAGSSQAWFNLCSRLATFFSSIAFGVFGGVANTKDEALNIERKKDKLSIFKNAYEQKLFMYSDEEEEAKAQYEEYLKTIEPVSCEVLD